VVEKETYMSLIEAPQGGSELYDQGESEDQNLQIDQAITATSSPSPEVPSIPSWPFFETTAPAPEPAAAPIVHIIERRPRWSKPKKALAIGAASLIALGGVEVNNLLGDWHLFHLGIHVRLPHESTPPDASASATQQEAKATTDQILCADNETFDIGSKAHSTEYWVSGFSVNHKYGDRALECDPDGFYVPVERTFNKAGVVTKAVVSEANYAPVNTSVDINNPVICMNLSASATSAQIEAATKLYFKEKDAGHVVNCNFGEKTTGLGVASANTAAADTVAALLFAQDAGALSPIDKQVYNKIVRDVTSLTREQEQARYPDAKIIIKKPKVPSEYTEILNSWDTQGADIKQALLHYHFVDVHGQTQLDVESAYDGIHGGIGFPREIPKDKLPKLNKLTHLTPNAVAGHVKHLIHHIMIPSIPN
jgi:hypothetical protein